MSLSTGVVIILYKRLPEDVEQIPGLSGDLRAVFHKPVKQDAQTSFGFAILYAFDLIFIKRIEQYV